MREVPFILASASPRRRQLIRSFPFKAQVLPSRAHEPRAKAGEAPRDYALGLAEKKAREVARRMKAGLVLGADTVVHLGGKILGKPSSDKDARKILSLLTGRWHEVHTGLCLIAVPGGKMWKTAAVTRVRMRRFTGRQLDVLSRRNHDKAGAYSAQSGNFVTDYRGDFDNVVGLPRRTLRGLLARAARAGVVPVKGR